MSNKTRLVSQRSDVLREKDLFPSRTNYRLTGTVDKDKIIKSHP